MLKIDLPRQLRRMRKTVPKTPGAPSEAEVAAVVKAQFRYLQSTRALAARVAEMNKSAERNY